MSNITILFGNGLGRALNNNDYTINRGLCEANKKLTQEDRNMISRTNNDFPYNEEELEMYHKIVSSCTELKKHQEKERKFLAEQGLNFPSIYSKYIFNVTKFYFDLEYCLPEKFVKNLIHLISSHQVNVVTLNYDKLLYGAFVDKGKILEGYDGSLVDGFHNKSDGFNPSNLERKFGKEFGWFLNLHGSPIFYSNKKGVIFKSHINDELVIDEEHQRTHFVLANTELKPEIIAKSELLGTYWDYFIRALEESEILILFGYGGLDKHVNRAISSWQSNKKINRKLIIISHKTDQENKWEEVFGPIRKDDLFLLECVLEYNFQNIG